MFIVLLQCTSSASHHRCFKISALYRAISGQSLQVLYQNIFRRVWECRHLVDISDRPICLRIFIKGLGIANNFLDTTSHRWFLVLLQLIVNFGWTLSSLKFLHSIVWLLFYHVFQRRKIRFHSFYMTRRLYYRWSASLRNIICLLCSLRHLVVKGGSWRASRRPHDFYTIFGHSCDSRIYSKDSSCLICWANQAVQRVNFWHFVTGWRLSNTIAHREKIARLTIFSRIVFALLGICCRFSD